MASYDYVVCDVFTDRALTGNALAVFTDARGMSSARMQALARELNLSETTFVLPPEGDGDARVRIFMPTAELPFAGHPTLGTAYVLARSRARLEVSLELGVGLVPVRFEQDGEGLGRGWMRQPSPSVHACADGTTIRAALGLQDNPETLPIERYENGPSHVFVEASSAEEVRDLTPNLSALANATRAGVSVYHADGVECVVRYFAPASGINEDPATGSAAGPLGVHLLRHGRLAPGERLLIEQGTTMGRPSRLEVRVEQSTDGYLVQVGGQVVEVAEGRFNVGD